MRRFRHDGNAGTGILQLHQKLSSFRPNRAFCGQVCATAIARPRIMATSCSSSPATPSSSPSSLPSHSILPGRTGLRSTPTCSRVLRASDCGSLRGNRHIPRPRRSPLAGKETLSLLGHKAEVASLDLSGDGKRLVSGSVDNTIKVWDLDSGKETLSLRGHANVVTSLALSGNGKRLFSGSEDHTVKLWDLDAGRDTLTLRGHTGDVTSLALSGDGKRLFSGSHGLYDKGVETGHFFSRILDCRRRTLTICSKTKAANDLWRT